MTPDRYKLEVLRGEGNLVLRVACSERDSARLAEWIARGSGYMVTRESAVPEMRRVSDAVGPSGMWMPL